MTASLKERNRRNIGRRVIDRFVGGYGTVMDSLDGRDVYRVAWDEPTRNQDEARAIIPGRFFAFVDRPARGSA